MTQDKPKNLNDALVQLAAVVAGSVGYIEEQITGITEGLLEQNPQRIHEVMQYTKNVRKLSNEVVQRVLQSFISFKPKGDDAKLILVSWRISVALERISVLLYDIGVQSENFNISEISGAQTVFLNIRDALMSQTYNMVIAYTSQKSHLITEIIDKEAHIKNVYKSFFREMIMFLLENPQMTSKVEKCLSIAKIFEMTSYYMHEISDHLSFKFGLKTSEIKK